ncbi:MAG TPA: MOSC domain-containing protein [Stellaceae bacterium]|nr:MOSC domain-containing protein [Stellaceae bacterium]
MATTIAAIYRYPVKGLSPERLDRVSLCRGECLPEDRRFALALATTRFDPAQPQWLPKTAFAMLMRDESLARLQTQFDPATGELTIARAGSVVLRAALTDPAGRRAVGDFIGEFLGDTIPRPLRVVAAPGHAFADARRKPNATTDQYVSLINRNSVTALADAVGAPVDELRFRANVYCGGDLPAWHELDWIGRDIALGGARLRGVAAITRCAATQVNPLTAARDLDIPAGLQRHFGHNLMGVYAEVAGGGAIALGDRLTTR